MQLIETLKSGEHIVTFTKKNGELRTMRGYLPEWADQKTPGTCPIVDSETGEFKSFIIDNLISIEKVA